MNEDEIVERRIKFEIENAAHGGWIVSEAGVIIYAASTSADLCYWLEGVLSRMDIKPESEAANPLPSFLGKAKALITGRVR
jgi:hypothetical protein